MNTFCRLSAIKTLSRKKRVRHSPTTVLFTFKQQGKTPYLQLVLEVVLETLENLEQEALHLVPVLPRDLEEQTGVFETNREQVGRVLEE